MSYAMPGMQYIPTTIDAPSGFTDLPMAPVTRGLLGSGASSAVSGSFSANYDASTMLILFIVVYFGAVGGLHYLSHARGMV